MSSEVEQCPCSKLLEADIPGSVIPDISKCKKSELQFWLKCRGLKFRTSDTKSELKARVQACSDKRYDLVDPDPNQAYTRAKRANCNACAAKENDDVPASESNAPQEPVDGWSRDIPVELKRFTHKNIMDWAVNGGKRLGAQGHSEKSLQRGYKFFIENYVHDCSVIVRDNIIFLKARCFRSQKKNKSPHKVSISICQLSNNVLNGFCSCVAGKAGLCNHVLGVLYSVDHYVKLGLTLFPQKGTCTDNPQQWHKPRTAGLSADPVMNVKIVKPRYESNTSGISCNLYEARAPQVQNEPDVLSLLCNLQGAGVCLGFNALHSDYALEPNNAVHTRMGFDVRQGSVLSYQLGLTAANFEVQSNIEPSSSDYSVHLDSYPTLPFSNVPLYNACKPATEVLSNHLHSIEMSSEESRKLEEKTRNQAENPLWHSARSKRITCSKFGQILHRKSSNHEKFIRNQLLKTSNLSSVPSVKFGVENESKAAEQYTTYMKNVGRNVKVMDAGFVVNPEMPWVGASPVRKVIDQEAGYGLLEVKCSFRNRNVPPHFACTSDRNFCMEMVNGKPRLKRNHIYYCQVQGQLGICGVHFCDFVVYTEKGLLVERIYFDVQFWDKMMKKLLDFFIDHFVPLSVGTGHNQ